MATYRVTAPYVTLKMRDHLDAPVIRGFYEGGVVSGIDADSLKHHLDNGMLEEVDAPSPVEADESQDSTGRPSVRAAKEDWVAYAVSQRGEDVSEDDARDAAEGTSKADLVAQYGG